MVLRNFVIIFLVLSGASTQRLNRQQCSREDFACASGQCIKKQKWCDSVQDCTDGTDELYCSGDAKCLNMFFTCVHSRCIPLSGRCDNVLDCPDGSDERNCILPNAPPREIPTNYSTDTRLAVSEAVSYLLNQRHPDYGWGIATSTSRANIALMMADRICPIANNEKRLMWRELYIQLSLQLIPYPPTPKLSHLALYINAMYATCQDVHNFNGINLVNLLRSETNKAMGSKFSLPLVLMTLCVLNEHTYQDERQLIELYDNSSKIANKAMTVLAMECFRRKTGNTGYSDHFKDFFYRLANLEDSNFDVYTKALVAQAADAVGRQIPSLELIKHQLKDGSFGDLLATYYAIPALLGSSMLDLKCGEDDGIIGTSLSPSAFEGKKVTYSLWISSGSDVTTHSMILTYKGNKTLYDLMRISESKDPMYRFRYEKTDKGIEVCSIADNPNEPEMDLSWKLYSANTERVLINSGQSLTLLSGGVDTIYPRNNSHYIFWFR